MSVEFYIGARSDEANGGIYGFDAECKRVFFEPLRGVSYMSFSPDKKLMYAVQKDGENNYAVVYHIRENGSLEYVDRRPTYGISSCHLTTDPAGKFLYCANYSSGTLNEYALSAGMFQGPECERIFKLTGTLGPNKKRQEHTHAHCTVFTPDGNYLCVVDLGADEVNLFSFDPEGGINDVPVDRYHSARPGAGPRHLLFSPDGNTAWLANEVDSTVSVLKYYDGTLRHVNTISTLPDDVVFDGSNTVAAVRLSPDGRHLMVSNRGHESIACFEVDADGGLSRYAMVPSGGNHPRDINFLPSGDRLVCCNTFSNTVTFFRYNSEDGSLTYLNQQEELPGPLCVVSPLL